MSFMKPPGDGHPFLGNFAAEGNLGSAPPAGCPLPDKPDVPRPTDLAEHLLAISHIRTLTAAP